MLRRIPIPGRSLVAAMLLVDMATSQRDAHRAEHEARNRRASLARIRVSADAGIVSLLGVDL